MHDIKKYRSVLITLVVASGLMVWIYLNAPEPQQKPIQVKMPKVPYVQLLVSNQSIPIYSRGRVFASEVRQITSEVPGLVRQVSKQLNKGSSVTKGDLLVQLDEQAYILEVAQKKADLDQAKLEQVRVKAKAAVAQKGLKNNVSEYARHIPQVRQASSQVAAAEAALAYAQKKLAKTTIRSPINGKVINLNITEGEFIKATSRIAKIYGTQSLYVRLPLNDQQIDILGLNNPKRASSATAKPIVRLNRFQSNEDRWLGYVDRIEGERDMNQLLYVIAQVSNDTPFNSGQKTLLPGSFVEAKIEGKKIKRLKILPRNAEQASNTVWVIDDNNQLRRKIIEVIYRGKKEVYLKAGLDENDRIVTGSFHLMAEGLIVQPYLLKPSMVGDKALASAAL
ncbi:MAG: RND family efflux transporter MFP subunit [Pseudohongiellaceae bacterium]|jgi:RND family efflux transporter MFP subunit